MNRSLEASNSDRWRYVAIALVALVVGVLLGRLLMQDENESSDRAGVAPTSDHGIERSESGAVEAATEFAQLVSAPSDGGSYRETVEQLAAPDWRTEANALATNTLEFLRGRYGSGGWWSFVPARYRVVEFSQDEATVELWGVTLATGPKIRGLEETWITGTLELIWAAEGWRVSGEDSVAGPTPELLTSDDERDVSVLQDFSEYESGPTP